jgi:putative pyruvate formate lyase activating enzyme
LLCEHRCGANRIAGERGPCQAAVEARVFRHRVECGEESELIPSHLFYLSGCDLRCAFCIAEANAFDPSRGTVLTSEFLQRAIPWGRNQGARNIQWVGGEPTIHIPTILAAMSEIDDLPPVVWKSDFYGTPEAFELLDGIVSVFVPDFKFGNDMCAQRIAGVPRYVEVVTRNLRRASGRADMIVRHLLLPGHWDCCFVPICEWLLREMPAVKFSLRDGYLPMWQARHHEDLSQLLKPGIGEQALEWATRLGLNVIR